MFLDVETIDDCIDWSEQVRALDQQSTELTEKIKTTIQCVDTTFHYT